MKISDLIQDAKNANTGTARGRGMLEKSLQKYGAGRSILIDKNNQIIAGNKTAQTAGECGFQNVRVIETDGKEIIAVKRTDLDINSKAGRELAFADNRVAEVDLAWSADQIVAAQESGCDVLDFWTEDEISALVGSGIQLEAQEDNFDVPEGGIETDIVAGDLFQIGNHRLLCGDSTDINALEKILNGEKADLVFTDPPYRIETEGGCVGSIGKGLRKQGKDISFIADFEPENFLNVFPLVFNKNTINSYIFTNKELLPEYLLWCKNLKISFNVLVWKKPTAIPIGGSHRPDIEYLLLFRKNAIWNGNLNDVDYSRLLVYGRETGLHPTMKPIELISNELKISSNLNSIVFDFFLGSGSTMVACHQLKRRCFGMELDPKYCQVIINRMQKLDPNIEIKKI